jgi:hypothetical protein
MLPFRIRFGTRSSLNDERLTTFASALPEDFGSVEPSSAVGGHRTGDAGDKS